MKKRYLVALVITAFAGADLHPALAVGWQAVSLIALAAATLLGAHWVDRQLSALDGLSVGAAQVDRDGKEDQ